MKLFFKIKRNDLIELLEYLLGHTEECYYNECKMVINRFLERIGNNNE